MTQAARARIHPPAVPIYASDVAFRMVDFARRNADARAGQYIQFNGGDALGAPAPAAAEPARQHPDEPALWHERIEVRGKAALTRDAGGSEERDGGDDFFRASPRTGSASTPARSRLDGLDAEPRHEVAEQMRLKGSRAARMPMERPHRCRLFRFDLVKARRARRPTPVRGMKRRQLLAALTAASLGRLAVASTGRRAWRPTPSSSGSPAAARRTAASCCGPAPCRSTR